MKIVTLVARILLGLIFLVFGLNGFFHFLPMRPIPGVAGQFVGALVVSHFFVFVSALQVLCAVLLLVNRFVPLAIILLGPVMVNILLFHIFMLPSGLPLALVTAALWFVAAVPHREKLLALFK